MAVFELATLATLVGIVVTTIVLIFTLSMFREWVRTKIGKNRNQQIISGLVRERLKTGDFKVTQFLYDESSSKFVDTEAVKAEILSEDLDEKLGNKDVLVESVSS